VIFPLALLVFHSCPENWTEIAAVPMSWSALLALIVHRE
jgi:hypothetical protein